MRILKKVTDMFVQIQRFHRLVPARLDQRGVAGLSRIDDDVCCQPTVSDLLAAGFLDIHSW